MSSILVYHPVGLGDHIVCSSIVREYAKTHERVGLFCNPQNEPSVSFLFRDLTNVKIHLFTSHKKAAQYRILNLLHLSPVHYDSILRVGSFDSESGIQYERQFYNSAHVAFEKLWDSFYIQREMPQEDSLSNMLAPPGPYIFVHDDARFPLDTAKINSTLPIVRPDLSATKNIFDYCSIIEKASEIHVIDSSFMFLVDCLAYSNPNQKLVVHRYARVNLAWNLPILKKDWHILL